MGIFTTPAEYFKVLRSLLMNDSKLLKSETVNLMFKPQLNPQATNALMQLYKVEEMQEKMGHLVPEGASKTYGLSGMLMLEDADNDKWRRKGTMVWGGLPNIIWMIDREAGLCALYASQVRPPGNSVSTKSAEIFERAMYARMSSAE